MFQFANRISQIQNPDSKRDWRLLEIGACDWLTRTPTWPCFPSAKGLLSQPSCLQAYTCDAAYISPQVSTTLQHDFIGQCAQEVRLSSSTFNVAITICIVCFRVLGYPEPFALSPPPPKLNPKPLPPPPQTNTSVRGNCCPHVLLQHSPRLCSGVVHICLPWGLGPSCFVFVSPGAPHQ